MSPMIIFQFLNTVPSLKGSSRLDREAAFSTGSVFLGWITKLSRASKEFSTRDSAETLLPGKDLNLWWCGNEGRRHVTDFVGRT